MIYETFITKTFRGDTLAIIETASGMIDSYKAQGYTLTLRQLYYQFVSRDLIPNTEKSYKRLGGIITDARQAGALPWDGIEDRGRSMQGWLIQEDITEIIGDLSQHFAVDLWDAQPYYVEVWVEKEALSNVVSRACRPLRVPYMACKGYLSASEAWRAGKRMEDARERGQTPLVIHLGDHDPSGIDMSRDNLDRLELFSNGEVQLERIALNMDQVRRYRPPPNPAKITDSRSDAYIAEHGQMSWELDALEPSVVVELIQQAIYPLIDDEAREDALERERIGKRKLAGINRHWSAIEDLIEEKDAE